MKITKEETNTLAQIMLRDQTKGYGKEELEQMIREVRSKSDDIQSDSATESRSKSEVESKATE